MSGTGISLTWFGNATPGTAIIEYQVRFQYNGGPWTFWQTFNAPTTSAQFVYQQVNPALGDGVYSFAVTARDNLNRQQPFDNVAQATVIVDLANKIQPAAFMPLISR